MAGFEGKTPRTTREQVQAVIHKAPKISYVHVIIPVTTWTYQQTFQLIDQAAGLH